MHHLPSKSISAFLSTIKSYSTTLHPWLMISILRNLTKWYLVPVLFTILLLTLRYENCVMLCCYALISSLINLAHLWCFHLTINTAQFFDNYFPVDFDLPLFSILQKSDGCEYLFLSFHGWLTVQLTRSDC